MPRAVPLAAVAAVFGLAWGAASATERATSGGQLATNANIITGIDMSYSIDAEDLRVEIEGLAQAIRAPEVLDAIRAGAHGRIGFAVFAWHHDQFPILVAWTTIATAEDAEAVARQIEARLLVDVEIEAREQAGFYIGRLTNLSQAIDHAAAMLREAPFATDRSVVNIIGDGEDNVGEGAGSARDRAVEMGGVVNGVVLTGVPEMLSYYRREVIGGPGAFVMSTAESAALVEALKRKFLQDLLVAGLDRPIPLPAGP